MTAALIALFCLLTASVVTAIGVVMFVEWLREPAPDDKPPSQIRSDQ